MSQQFIRDSHQNPIAKFTETADIKQIWNMSGNLLATYHKRTDITTSASGSTQIRGDALATFAPRGK